LESKAEKWRFGEDEEEGLAATTTGHDHFSVDPKDKSLF
jgi:hypothetical protein